MVQVWSRGGRRGLVFRGTVAQLRGWLRAAAATGDLRAWLAAFAAN